jgi:3-dehydroquinate synthetase
VSGFTVRHGEAVAIGLVAAANLSARLGYCRPALEARLEKILSRLHLPTRVPAGLEIPALVGAMRRDKKKKAGRLRFILIREVGDVFVTADVPEEAVIATLEAIRA